PPHVRRDGAAWTGRARRSGPRPECATPARHRVHRRGRCEAVLVRHPRHAEGPPGEGTRARVALTRHSTGRESSLGSSTRVKWPTPSASEYTCHVSGPLPGPRV